MPGGYCRRRAFSQQRHQNVAGQTIRHVPDQKRGSAVTYISTVTVTPSAALTTMTDPETGHRMIMEFWPNVPTRESQGARATVGALWSTQTVTPHDGTILVRS